MAISFTKCPKCGQRYNEERFEKCPVCFPKTKPIKQPGSHGAEPDAEPEQAAEGRISHNIKQIIAKTNKTPPNLTTICNACSGKVSKNAKICPHCGEPMPAQSITNKFISVAVTVLLLIIAIDALTNMWLGTNIWFGRDMTHHIQQPVDIKEKVYHASCALVKEHLKAPSTADFPYYPDPGISVTEQDEPLTYQVAAYVDAQNGFGAKIRTHYVATLKKNGKDWRLKDISFDHD